MSVLLKNARVWKWTGPYNGTTVDGIALSVHHGVIQDVSTSYDESIYDTVYDMHGRLLLPGLNDSHLHVLLTGESQYFVDLKDCNSIEMMISKLKMHAKKYPDISWIQGVNWDQTDLKRYPCRQDLDSACSSRPVFLWRACWHIGCANTLALKLAGIEVDRTCEHSIIGGVIDTEESVPTGILRERAVEIVVKAMGDKDATQKKKFITEGLSLCLRMGLTSVQTNDEACYHIYKSMVDEGSLPIRVFLTPTHADLTRPVAEGGVLGVEPFATGRCHQAQLGDSFNPSQSLLSMNRIKIFSDGSLGAETAALRVFSNSDIASDTKVPVDNSQLSKNYIQSLVTDIAVNKKEKSAYTGVLIQSNAELERYITSARERGFRLEIHAIGDKAAEQVLDALQACGVPSHERPILTHCQVLGPDLIDRMRDMGVVANIQPSFVPTDMRWVQDRLSPRHQQYAYAWRTLLEANVVVAGGSDAPIESCSPLLGIHDAIFRQSRTPTTSPFATGEETSCIPVDPSAPAAAPATQSSTSVPPPTALSSTSVPSQLAEITHELPITPSLSVCSASASPTLPNAVSLAQPQAAEEFDTFRPEERLTFAEALWLYTVGAAFAAGSEGHLGRLEIGFLADIVAVDPAVLDDHRLLRSVQPDMVMVGGTVKFASPAFSSTLQSFPQSELKTKTSFESSSANGRTDTGADAHIPTAAPATLGGPFVPGKNGKTRRVSCACVLLGRPCALDLRQSFKS